MDEVDADDYEAVCLFESDVEAFSNQYGREPKEPLEWLAWRKDAAGRSASYCWMQSASRSNSARSRAGFFILDGLSCHHRVEIMSAAFSRGLWR